MRALMMAKKTGGGGWQPGANTVAYYKFDNNLNDSSGNGHDFSIASGSVSYGTTSDGAKYAYFNNNTWTNYWTVSNYYYGAPITVLFWFQPKQDFGTSGNHAIFEIWGQGKGFMRLSNTFTFGDITDPALTYQMAVDSWYLVGVSRVGNVTNGYINGSLIGTGTPYWTEVTNNMRVRINQVPDTGSSTYANNGYLSELIREDKFRTTQEITNYYNQTKGNYGIS